MYRPSYYDSIRMYDVGIITNLIARVPDLAEN